MRRHCRLRASVCCGRGHYAPRKFPRKLRWFAFPVRIAGKDARGGKKTLRGERAHPLPVADADRMKPVREYRVVAKVEQIATFPYRSAAASPRIPAVASRFFRCCFLRLAAGITPSSYRPMQLLPVVARDRKTMGVQDMPPETQAASNRRKLDHIDLVARTGARRALENGLHPPQTKLQARVRLTSPSGPRQPFRRRNSVWKVLHFTHLGAASRPASPAGRPAERET